eukprot:12316562-Prorocentrum_lima.AAC.1
MLQIARETTSTQGQAEGEQRRPSRHQGGTWHIQNAIASAPFTMGVAVHTMRSPKTKKCSASHRAQLSHSRRGAPTAAAP